MFDFIDYNQCIECQLWNKAAIDNGYQSGMCEKCYNKYYITFKGIYEPKHTEIKGKDE